MFSRSLIFLLIALIVLLCESTVAGTYTVVFQDGLRGYGGAMDAYIARDQADANIGAQDCFMARKTPETGQEQRALVRFTDMNLPPDAKVVSAK